MESFYESLNCRPLDRSGDRSQNRTPPREPQFRNPAPDRRAREPQFRTPGPARRPRDLKPAPAPEPEPEPEPHPEPEPEPEPEPQREPETRDPRQRSMNTNVLPLSPPSSPSTSSLLGGLRKVAVIVYVWGPWICYGGVVLSALATVAWFFQKLSPIMFFVVGNLSWSLTAVSAAASQAFSALPSRPALPSFFSHTPSSATSTDGGPPGIRLVDDSTRVLQVPLELGLVVSGTGVSFEVSTSHARFLIDTLSEEQFGLEKPMLTHEVQRVSVSWNSVQKRWDDAKRTWETEMSRFFFNFSWESDQLSALADMWDKADEEVAARSRLEHSASMAPSILLKLRRYFQGADRKTRPQSARALQTVGRLRETVERQIDMSGAFLNDLQEIHGYIGKSRSVSCRAGNFLLSRRQTARTTSPNAVSDNVLLGQASDSMYAFCKTMETSIVEMDDLISKVGEDVDILKKVVGNLSKGFNSLVVSMEAKKDSLVKDGDEHAESERLVRIGVVSIVRDSKDELVRHFAAQYNL